LDARSGSSDGSDVQLSQSAMWGVDRPSRAERLYLEGHRQTVGM
jgi:hypothetical protein